MQTVVTMQDPYHGIQVGAVQVAQLVPPAFAAAAADGSDVGDYNESDDEGEEGYVAGGYHRVSLGEIYNNRYRTVAKLGWGHFSTVWLCEDLQAKGYVAMKVQKSARHYKEAAYDEISILSRASTTTTADGARPYVVELFDNFEHPGASRDSAGAVMSHVCMVFEVMGPNVLALIKKYNFKGVPLALVRKVALDILLGLEHLHGCGMIHTDLKPENVLVSCPLGVPVDKRGMPLLNEAPNIPAELLRQTKQPEAAETVGPPFMRKQLKPSRSDPSLLTTYGDEAQEILLGFRMPYHHKATVAPAKEGKGASNKRHDGRCFPRQDHIDKIRSGCLDLFWHEDAFFKVADLGNACWVDRHFSDDIQTRQYRSPEVIVGSPYDTAADIWSLGCMLFELATGDYLFDPKACEEYPRDEDHLALTMELLGRMPKRLIDTGTRAKTFFNRSGDLRHIKSLQVWGLLEVFVQKYRHDRAEVAPFAEFLGDMLKLDPQDRKSAAELKHHPFLHGADVRMMVEQLRLDAGKERLSVALIDARTGARTTLQAHPNVPVFEVARQIAVEGKYYKVTLLGPDQEVLDREAALLAACESSLTVVVVGDSQG
mmetsp:Transcript_11244/g.24829  ORF Transcript_11244/g.24829 Transcript_11244/m.24829 type:complete len:598 (-) Transcript_11244:323-2116(-)